MYAQNEKSSDKQQVSDVSNLEGKKNAHKGGRYHPDNRPGKTTQLKSAVLDDNRVKQFKVNNTGLPNQLKTNIENLSGHSMDNVKVHYNSSKPAQLHAHAYAQGTDIHIGPGKEKYLPHEAWHVVQQKQGRVRPTAQYKSKISINDDVSLEREADLMGAKAAQLRLDNIHDHKKYITASNAGTEVVQPAWDIEEVLAILRSTEAGVEAAKRIIGHNIEIVQHPKDAVFPKFIVVGGKIVQRENPQFMDGYSEATKIHISNQMDAHHAAAMIVHESTHSVQKLPGGMVDTMKKAGASKKDIEYSMEEEAHVNQYRHEIESGEMSQKGRAVLDKHGTGIDMGKVRAQIDGLYQTGGAMTDLEMQARNQTVAARKPILKAFQEQVMAVYTPKEMKGIFKRLYAEEQEREKDEVNPYALDMPDYGKRVQKDLRTGLPAGAMPYIT